MIVFTLALYGIPVVLALVTMWIGAKGAQFYWSEVIRGGAATVPERSPAEDPRDGS